MQLYDTLGSPAKLCHLWFHTGFIARNYLYFPRSAIDKACGDRRNTTFSPGFGIELYLTRIAPEAPASAAADVEDATAATPAIPHTPQGGAPGHVGTHIRTRSFRTHSLVSALLAGVSAPGSVGSATVGTPGPADIGPDKTRADAVAV